MVIVKKNCITKSKPSLDKPEGNFLEKEINKMIDREKTKGKIVSKLLNKSIQPTEKQKIE